MPPHPFAVGVNEQLGAVFAEGEIFNPQRVFGACGRKVSGSDQDSFGECRQHGLHNGAVFGAVVAVTIFGPRDSLREKGNGETLNEDQNDDPNRTRSEYHSGFILVNV